jgi:hypothetical protein
MLDKPIEQITAEDVKRLITDRVREGKMIDYKSQLPGCAERDIKDFLADVSSFANSSGGSLVYGMRDSDGCASEICGVTVEEIDKEIQRMDNLIRDGLDPRISYQIKHVDVDGKMVFVIAVKRSWISPHRVTYRSHNEFYARNSQGKYPLDVSELRLAFTLSDSINDRIKKFQENRIAKLLANETPTLLNDTPKVALHLLPIGSFDPTTTYDIKPIGPADLRPMRAMGWNDRLNIDGLLTFSGGGDGSDPSHAYAQLYRNGIIEAVTTSAFMYSDKGKRIANISLEKALIEALPGYISVQRRIGVDVPIAVFVTYIGAEGYLMNSDHEFRQKFPIDRDVLQLPECLIESFEDVNPVNVLRPMFDLAWNACGYSRSLNFDENGNWCSRDGVRLDF